MVAATHGIASDVARDGAIVFVLLHEAAHAIFDQLRVPILGREEDAADQLAAFMLLRAGEGVARRVLVGAASMYLHDSMGRMPDDKDFSDVHGLDAQRFYNVLCMAHGSNPAAFGAMVEKGLPSQAPRGDVRRRVPAGLPCGEKADRPGAGPGGLGAHQGGAQGALGKAGEGGFAAVAEIPECPVRTDVHRPKGGLP
jgi:hypothetical protein